jgi:hypothetical protein
VPELRRLHPPRRIAREIATDATLMTGDARHHAQSATALAAMNPRASIEATSLQAEFDRAWSKTPAELTADTDWIAYLTLNPSRWPG